MTGAVQVTRLKVKPPKFGDDAQVSEVVSLQRMKQIGHGVRADLRRSLWTDGRQTGG